MVVPFLRLLNLPSQHVPGSTLYLRILFLGTGFIFTYSIFSAIFRAIGNSRTPLIFLIVASEANIILDLGFVLLLGWDIADVALATIMAQALSALLFIYYTAKKVPFLWSGIETLAMMPMFSISSGLSTYTAQNIAARPNGLRNLPARKHPGYHCPSSSFGRWMGTPFLRNTPGDVPTACVNTLIK